jgi:hypothetical protein
MMRLQTIHLVLLFISTVSSAAIRLEPHSNHLPLRKDLPSIAGALTAQHEFGVEIVKQEFPICENGAYVRMDGQLGRLPLGVPQSSSDQTDLIR